MRHSPRERFERVAVWTLIGLTATVTFTVAGSAWTTLAEYTGTYLVAVPVGLLAGAVVYLAYLSGERSDADERAGRTRNPIRTASLACAAALLILGAIVTYERGADIPLHIEAYCAYGSVSAAQRNSCEDNVSYWTDIRSRRTAAARFARRPTQVPCGDAAGPFCENYREWALVEEAYDATRPEY